MRRIGSADGICSSQEFRTTIPAYVATHNASNDQGQAYPTISDHYILWSASNTESDLNQILSRHLADAWYITAHQGATRVADEEVSTSKSLRPKNIFKSKIELGTRSLERSISGLVTRRTDMPSWVELDCLFKCDQMTFEVWCVHLRSKTRPIDFCLFSYGLFHLFGHLYTKGTSCNMRDSIVCFRWHNRLVEFVLCPKWLVKPKVIWIKAQTTSRQLVIVCIVWHVNSG